MSLTTSAITGRVPMPNNIAPLSGSVTFTLVGYDTQGVNVVPSGASATFNLTDAGELPAGARLWRNTEGLRGTVYLVTVRWREAVNSCGEVKENTLGHVQVQNAASYTVPQLLNAVPPDTQPGQWWSAITQAQYDEMMASVSAVRADRLAADASASAANTSRAAADAAAARAEGAAVIDSRAVASTTFRPAVAPNKIMVAGYSTPGDGGASLHVKVSSPPAHGYWFSVLTQGGETVLYALSESLVRPEMFGAIIGSPDINLGLNRMFNYQKSTGAMIDGNEKSYPLTDTLSLPNDSRVPMRNITFDGTGIPVNGLFTTPVAQQLCPAPSLERNLAANADADATSVTVGNSAGYAVNDFILIRSNRIMAETEVSGDATRHSRACEMLQISAISGNVISFRSRLVNGYSTADSAYIAKIQTAGSVDFDNVKFIGADTGFYTTDSFKSRYRNCSFINMSSRGLFEDRCYLTDGDNWYFEGNAFNPTFTQAAYGLCYMASQNGNYGNVRGHRVRHLTTTGSNQSSRGRSVSRGNVLGDIYATDCFAAPVDQHPGGGFIQVGNVFATFADNASQLVACQFQGGGGQVGNVEAENGAILQFDCYGFFQNNFTPYVYIASGHSRHSTHGVRVLNLTNRYGTGQAQPIRFQIGNADFYSGVGVELTPSSGDIEGGVTSGNITALTNYGNGRCVYGTASDGVARLRFGNVNMRSTSGARIIQMDGGTLQMSGGILSGVSGNAELRANNATVYLIGTVENSITDTVLGTGAIRRVSYV